MDDDNDATVVVVVNVFCPSRQHDDDSVERRGGFRFKLETHFRNSQLLLLTENGNDFVIELPFIRAMI